MLQGLMMDRPLLISSIMEYAAEVHAGSEIVSRTTEGPIHRYTYADSYKRMAQLAHALNNLGVKPGDRIATLAWNNHRHFELYYAISGIGAVCHTINPRLFEDQLIYVTNHAEDKLLFTELTFVPLLEKLQDKLPADMRYVIMTDSEHMPETSLPDPLCFEDLLGGQPETITWPEFDENTAAGLCYTSGTTGNPKGVLFSHRSNLIHGLGVLASAPFDINPRHALLPVVPLFHVNAWGLPYYVPLRGVKMVFPGPALDGASLFELMDGEQVNSAWGVPTVWLGLLGEMRNQGRKPAGFEHVIIGGSAAPGPMIAEFEDTYGVEPIHGWGMTEMSPVGTLTTMTPEDWDRPPAERRHLKTPQGRRMYGVDMKIVDDAGARLPHDGEAFGELLVRGAGVMRSYFNDEAANEDRFDDEGWLRTGDVARIDRNGYMSIVDRTKDVVKSGGEWISSIDLENVALGHPAIAECAVIGIEHPKWSERPLLVAVKVEGVGEVTPDEVCAFLDGKVAKWWLPDDVQFVDSLPHTATGKVSKLQLRERFKDYVLPTA